MIEFHSLSRREMLGMLASSALLTLHGYAQESVVLSGSVTSVCPYKGRPQFFIGDVPYGKPVFETYVPLEKYFRQFAEAGTDVFCYSTNLGAGFGTPVWLGPDSWDFSALDEVAHRILSVNPDALIMPRIYLTAPDWWVQANPQECQVLSDGGTVYKSGVGHRRDNAAFPSLASEKWRSETAAALKHLIRHIQESDYGAHLFGYMITGLMSEEWYHWSIHTEQLSDYSVHAVGSFAAWLRKKYGSDTELQKAWNNPQADFSSVTVPSKELRCRNRDRIFRDPETEMQVIDWYLFYNELVPDTMEVFLRAAKEACDYRKVVGAFYCYMFEFGGDPEYGHNALGKLLQSPHLDFAVVTASYFDRALGKGADYARAPITSVRLHGKLWYHDNDTVSFKYDEINAANPDRDTVARYRKELGVTETAEETIWQYRRGAGFVLGNGVYQSFFDLHGGYFDDPALMAEIQRLNQLLDLSKEWEYGSIAEILVVSDEASCSYMTFESAFMQQTLQPAQVQFAKIGAPHDSILLEDLPLVDMSRYKMVIFLNCYHLTEEQRQWIRERILCGGRTVLWCYAAGLFDGARTCLENMQELTGFQFAYRPEAEKRHIQIVLTDAGRKACCGDMPSLPLLIGHAHIWAAPMVVFDEDAIALGTLEGGTETALARKNMSGWTSVYTMNPVLSAVCLRNFARQAGVHIFNDKDDTCYTSNGFIAINADGTAVRTILFPNMIKITEPLTGHCLAQGVKSYSRLISDKETLLLRWDRE